jgi:hypothetical protein
MSDELRRVRDTLIEELRKSETLTVAGRALYARYAAMSEAVKGADAPPAPEQAPEPPPPAPAARPQRRAPAEDDEEFGGSFMVRPTSANPAYPGYREAAPQSDLPRSLRDRRR